MPDARVFSKDAYRFYSEHIDGTKVERTQLKDMISQLQEGDIVVVWKLDRLGRSLPTLYRYLPSTHIFLMKIP